MSTAMIFWDVDTQVDFIRPSGRLYVPGAEEIVPNLRDLTLWANRHDVLIVASMCAHREGDLEFQQYPPHCLVGTHGQEKIPETRLPKQAVIPSIPVEVPQNLHDYSQVIIEKQQFDVFANPNTEAVLAVLGKEPEIVLYGLVTEICVAWAARGLLDRRHRLTVVRDAVHHLDESKANATLAEIEHRGGKIVSIREILKEQAA
jgi:nicotinamidase/pyrazinamidase